MTTLRLLKTSFTAGEVAPPLLGRSDLAAYDNGAAKLRNVFIHPTGGITRRAGLRHIGRARKTLLRYATPTAMTAPNGGTAANANDDNPATKLVPRLRKRGSSDRSSATKPHLHQLGLRRLFIWRFLTYSSWNPA